MSVRYDHERKNIYNLIHDNDFLPYAKGLWRR